ncbi:uncharacterized protein LOC6725558 [Drosophila simulans]|uniref:GD16960 n=2 Tax=melanogaster subgroup TaxID=32351 RepID=B4R756_DROSI|nr:uncharacterized protein LOC6725558 [Drosophila simulans]XP_033169350.1 uncharacterized protein LOC117146869 [Drosophila mauritiana]EDX17525.1 GD16960 [Drosophila simulans]KMZ08967.1 uncharacterized protein Dsimw501_GD16960 [Drosophila simulans]
MLLPADRLEQYKASLEQQLKHLATSIRSYLCLKSATTPELSNKANRLWELGQRYQLVKGSNQAATVALLSVCQDVYRSLQDSISKLVSELGQISAHVIDFEIECLHLNNEQQQTKIPAALMEFRNFLEESLKLLQNQVKYLELHLSQLQPKFSAPESSLEAFKSDLHLSEPAEARITLGLAKIERLAIFPLTL